MYLEADKVIVTLALGGLAVSGLLFASALVYPYLRDMWDKATALARAVFCGAAVVACLFGGAKSKFKFADGLKDNGSYATNDTVYIAWTTTKDIPSTNTVFIENRGITNTSGTFDSLGNTTIGSGSWTGTLADATNYDYNVWHDYVEAAIPSLSEYVDQFWLPTAYQNNAFDRNFLCNIDGNSSKLIIMNDANEQEQEEQ